MLLILSAQMVGDEIAMEFGQLPPSFLPLGSKRLFELQADFAHGEACVLTLPEDFSVSAFDEFFVRGIRHRDRSATTGP